MLSWIQYLNYRLYKYYVRKRESDPKVPSCMLSTLLIYVLLYDIVEIFSDTFFNTYSIESSYLPPILVALAISSLVFVFFAVYYKGKHKVLFSEFEDNEVYYRHWKKSIPVFIISVSLLTVILLVVADMQNHGKLRKPLFSKRSTLEYRMHLQ